jgi:hypothetical protein
MANGTTDEKIARAERLREQSTKAQFVAEQNRRGTQNAIANLRRSRLPSYNDTDEVSEVTANVRGIHARTSLPRAGRLALAIGMTVLLLAFAVHIVVKDFRP